MINHISIGVRSPEKVAGVLAELWNGVVVPFPPAPDSFVVLANDGRGSMIEITPINIVLEPGEGLFQLIELWLEDRLMIEVMTPEMTKRYLEITDPAFLAQAFGLEIPTPQTNAPVNLNLVG